MSSRTIQVWVLALGVTLVTSGCGRTMSTPAPTPISRPADVSNVTTIALKEVELPPLPDIPEVRGAPLRPRVVYPVADQLVTARDSNFVFGSVGSGDASLRINDIDVPVRNNGTYLAFLPLPGGATPTYELTVVRGSDTVRYGHGIRTTASVALAAAAARPTPAPARRPPPPPPAGPVALGSLRPVPSDTDRVINVRSVSNGTYKWLLIPGTIVERVSTAGEMTRVRLDSGLDAFVATSDVVELPDGRLPTRVVPNMRVVPDSAWTDVIFPLADPPPFLIEEERDKLIVTLYSTRATTDIINYRSGDAVVRAVTWEPLTNDRVRYVIHLRDAPYGYMGFHDGRQFVVRVRRAPSIDRARPLRGMIIAVDAGHPPAGSTGPSGVSESALTLPIARALQEELERRGAQVVMTRTNDAPLGLADRPAIARRAGAHAFVSVHLNALPDGINPFTAHGTGTYYFNQQSEPLARAVQDGMVRTMRLRDLGINYDNLAVIRPSWMPAVLAEGAFIMVPEHEAAMLDPVGQRLYARGVADGLEAYFRALVR